MMWILKNIGLVFLSMCIVAGATSVWMDMQELNVKLDKALAHVGQFDKYAQAVSETALRK